MAKEPKLSKRELAGPDKFQETSQSYLDWAHNHPREVLLGGLGLLLVILAIGLAFGRSTGPKTTKAGIQLSEALALLDRPVATAGAPAPEAGTPTFASETEKQQAVEKALVAVREEHPDEDAARTALLPLADARFKLGKYDEAVKDYDAYLSSAREGDPMRFLALEGRATALEAKGDLAGAMEAWERMQKDAPDFEDRALFGKAQLLEREQKWDDARTVYEQLKKDHAQSPVMRQATERLATLNVLHPPAAGQPAGAADAG